MGPYGGYIQSSFYSEMGVNFVHFSQTTCAMLEWGQVKNKFNNAQTKTTDTNHRNTTDAIEKNGAITNKGITGNILKRSFIHNGVL